MFTILNIACKKDDKGDDVSKSLIGIWYLTKIENKISNETFLYPDTLDKPVFIEITDSNIVNLTGYCNAGSAQYETKDNTITFSQVSMTELVCFNVGGKWESYLYEIRNAKTFELENENLNLLTDGDINLYFMKVE